MRSVIALGALAILFSGMFEKPAAMQVSASATFSELDSYGEWYKLPQLGWVWAPNRMPTGWRPFMYGHWAWTSDNGWLWVSDQPFGWIVCHYGYWHHSNEFGWLWVPGYEWSPARVQWVVTDYDVAWAPLPPPGRRLPPAFKPEGARHWVVVPSNNFTAPQVHKVHVVRKGPAPGRPAAVRRKGPPDVKYVQRTTRGPLKVFAIEKSAHPVQGRKLVKYKLREQAVGRRQPPGHAKKVIVKKPGPKPAPGQRGVGLKKGHAKQAEPEPAHPVGGVKKVKVKKTKKAADVDAAVEELKAKQEKEEKEQEGEEESELEERSREQQKKKAAKMY
jgi:hypothetical protein